MTRFQLGERFFPSTVEARDKVWNLLNSADVDVPLTGETAELLSALLHSGRHPDSLEMIGSGVEFMTVRKVARGDNHSIARCCLIHRTNGTEIEFPYAEAFRGQSNPQVNVVTALRTEIKTGPGTFDFAAVGVCHECWTKVVISAIDMTQVRLSFNELALRFAAVVGGWDYIAVINVGPYGRRISNSLVSEVWRTYYAGAARLSPVHEDCRLVKSADVAA